MEADTLEGYAETLAGLASGISSRDLAAALAAALLALSRLLPDLALTARLMADLTAMSAVQVHLSWSVSLGQRTVALFSWLVALFS